MRFFVRLFREGEAKGAVILKFHHSACGGGAATDVREFFRDG
jgi:hypothetical protein